MVETYVVEMRLVCDKLGPNALLEFDNRWPRSLERAWSRLHYPVAAGVQLENRLNEVIYLACKPFLLSDSGLMAQGVSAFEAHQWQLGHERKYNLQCPILIKHPQGTEPWVFHYGTSKSCSISIHASWQIRTH